MRMLAPAAATAALAAALAIAPAAPSWGAELPSQVSFTEGASLDIEFGQSWVLEASIVSKNSWGDIPLGPQDGTVDLVIEGLPGQFITAAPIAPGGKAYFSQPANEPLIGAGTYSVTAQFSPYADSQFLESTSEPLTLTVSPLTVEPRFEVVVDPAEVPVPTVRTTITGTYDDRFGHPPSGFWLVTTTASDGEVAFETRQPQPTEATEGEVGTFDIPITSKLEPGETYSVDAVFVPDASIARGLELTLTPRATFATEPLTVGQALSLAVVTPVWLVVISALILLALVGALLAIVFRLRRVNTETAEVTEALLVNRLTSRIVLFDRQGRVLLFLTKAPDSSGVSRWLTPGGGVDPGETHEEAAIRELFEETGLTGIDLGEPVWMHDFTVEWDEADHDTGHAVFFTATVDEFEPSTEHWTDDERIDVIDSRWWTREELESTAERFEPAELIELVRRLQRL